MLQKGDKVPSGLKGILVTPEDATSGSGGKTVSLSSLSKDRLLVLYFYPKDMTPGCTTEMQMFRDTHKDFEALGAEVVGCSRDSVERHCKFMQKENANFPLLTDDTGAITEAFGVWGKKKLYGKEYMGIQRATFLIKNGKVLEVWPKVKPATHPQEVLEAIRKL